MLTVGPRLAASSPCGHHPRPQGRLLAQGEPAAPGRSAPARVDAAARLCRRLGACPTAPSRRRRPLALQAAAAGCRGAAAAPAAVAPVQRRRGARVPSPSSGLRRRGIPWRRGAEVAAHASGAAPAARARDARLPARARAARGAARRRQAGEHHGRGRRGWRHELRRFNPRLLPRPNPNPNPDPGPHPNLVPGPNQARVRASS